MVALPSFGDGAGFAFGDAGPINSQDDNRVSFSTGAFGNRGGSTTNSVVTLAAGAAIAGLSIWVFWSLSH